MHGYRLSDIGNPMFGGPWQHHGKRRILRPMTLRMLYDGAKNGAELMDAIETMTHGRWRPSPGSVYPLLDDLTKEKLVRKRDDGRYELTPEAIREMRPPWERGEAQSRGAEETMRELEGYASYFEELSATDPDEWAEVKPRLAALAKRWNKLTEK
jgi:DNA-binding PadR family transcriptional regulator